MKNQENKWILINQSNIANNLFRTESFTYLMHVKGGTLVKVSEACIEGITVSVTFIPSQKDSKEGEYYE